MSPFLKKAETLHGLLEEGVGFANAAVAEDARTADLERSAAKSNL
jgi:hypothetical protein